METDLKGKKALITGGGSGIGFGIAKSLAQEGVDLAIASRNPSDEAINELKKFGTNIVVIKTDLSKEKNVINMIKKTISKFGHLDIYINNAAGSWHEPITKLTTGNWLKTINTNLLSCVWACREVSKYMIKHREGNILIIGSTATYHPLYKETSYRISKTGLMVFMEILSIELAFYGIRVNMIVPGAFKTKMTENFFNKEVSKVLLDDIPMRRFGRPEEVGPSAVLLLSNKLSSYTTGAILTIDGGVRLRPHKLYNDDEILRMNMFKN